MRFLLMAYLLALTGCEGFASGSHIMDCSYGCEKGGGRMLSFSQADGCRCVDSADAGR